MVENNYSPGSMSLTILLPTASGVWWTPLSAVFCETMFGDCKLLIVDAYKHPYHVTPCYISIDAFPYSV